VRVSPGSRYEHQRRQLVVGELRPRPRGAPGARVPSAANRQPASHGPPTSRAADRLRRPGQGGSITAAFRRRVAEGDAARGQAAGESLRRCSRSSCAYRFQGPRRPHQAASMSHTARACCSSSRPSTAGIRDAHAHPNRSSTSSRFAFAIESWTGQARHAFATLRAAPLRRRMRLDLVRDRATATPDTRRSPGQPLTARRLLRVAAGRVTRTGQRAIRFHRSRAAAPPRPAHRLSRVAASRITDHTHHSRKITPQKKLRLSPSTFPSRPSPLRRRRRDRVDTVLPRSWHIATRVPGVAPPDSLSLGS